MSLSSGRSATVTRRAPFCCIWLSNRHTKSATRSARNVHGAEIPEHPRHVRHAGEHHAAIGDGIGELQLLPSMVKSMSPSTLRWKPVAVTTISAWTGVPERELEAGLGEPCDLAGDDRRLARADRLEQIAVGHEAEALPPRRVRRGEMRLDVVVRARARARTASMQFRLQRLGLFECAVGEGA